MPMERSMHRLVAVLLMLSLVFGVSSSLKPESALGFGSFETSAFRIRWSDRWQEVRRTEANIVLHDGITEIQMVGILDDVSPQESVAEVVTDWFTGVLPTAEQVTEVPGTAAADETRASMVYTYQYPTSAESLVPYAVYFEVRKITPDLLLWIVVDTEWGAFNADPRYFERALQTLEIVGTPTSGEASQTFAAGGWRVSVPVASVAEGFPALGLAPQDGMQWVVVLADVVNWTAALAEFDTVTAQIVIGDGERFGPSPLHGQSAALALRLQRPAGALVSIDAEALVRVPLVFQLPDTAENLFLEIGDQRLALEDLLDRNLEASKLPPEQLAPLVQEGTISGLEGESHIRLQLPGGAMITTPLTGITLPQPAGCHGRETWTEVMSLIGQRVLIEADAGILGNEHRWLWLDGPGGRVLLNQRFVEQGLATVLAVPETSRFANWLNETEETAKATGAGLWQTCRASTANATSETSTSFTIFEIEPGVDPRDADLVREGFALAERIFTEYAGQPVGRPLTVVVRAGASDRSETSGMYQADVIDMFTGSPAWEGRADIERVKVMVHEYAHFYLDPAPQGRARPIWLEEGLAEMLSWQLLDRAGLVTNSEMLAYQALHIRVWPPGSDLCVISQQSISGIAYPLASLGAALLVEQAPSGSISDYRDAMAEGMPHLEAFATAFGVDESTFCAGAMDRIWSIPPSPSMPSVLYARLTEVAPSHVSIDAPSPTLPGSQLLLEAQTTDSAVCEWQLALGQTNPPLARTVMADGEGDAFWLVSIPPETAPGLATVSLTCGAVSDQVSVQVGV